MDLDCAPIRSVNGEEKHAVIRARNWLRLEYRPSSAARFTPLASRVSYAGAVKTLSGAC
jgi:hypothetical protein